MLESNFLKLVENKMCLKAHNLENAFKGNTYFPSENCQHKNKLKPAIQVIFFSMWARWHIFVLKKDAHIYLHTHTYSLCVVNCAVLARVYACKSYITKCIFMLQYLLIVLLKSWKIYWKTNIACFYNLS